MIICVFHCDVHVGYVFVQTGELETMWWTNAPVVAVNVDQKRLAVATSDGIVTLFSTKVSQCLLFIILLIIIYLCLYIALNHVLAWN